METYVLIGPKNCINFSNCLTVKNSVEATLKLHEKLNEPSEVKYEFQAASFEVAKIVSDEKNGYIEDIDEFIRDLADHYGYKVVPKGR
jgi:hypothetical protein